MKNLECQLGRRGWRGAKGLPLFLLVQHECIPQAILGMDVLCQAKSGMGKTAVFVLATLQQLEPITGQVCLRQCWGGHRDWLHALSKLVFLSAGGMSCSGMALMV